MKRIYTKLRDQYDRMTVGERWLILLVLITLGSLWAIYDFGRITK